MIVVAATPSRVAERPTYVRSVSSGGRAEGLRFEMDRGSENKTGAGAGAGAEASGCLRWKQQRVWPKRMIQAGRGSEHGRFGFGEKMTFVMMEPGVVTGGMETKLS